MGVASFKLNTKSHWTWYLIMIQIIKLIKHALGKMRLSPWAVLNRLKKEIIYKNAQYCTSCKQVTVKIYRFLYRTWAIAPVVKSVTFGVWSKNQDFCHAILIIITIYLRIKNA